MLHGRIALKLASATEQDALDVLDRLVRRAQERLTLELETSKAVLTDLSTASFSATEKSLETVLRQEMRLLERWSQWYDEAMMSVTTMPVDGASMALEQRVTSARAQGKRALAEATRALQSVAR